MLLAYLAAPLTPVSGETREGNLLAAKRYYRELSLAHEHVAILAPWILNAEMFEETERFREIGMNRNFAIIGVCDELWICGPRISNGMTVEIHFATQSGLRVRNYSDVPGTFT